MERDIAIAIAAIAAFALLFWLLERWACARHARKARKKLEARKAKAEMLRAHPREGSAGKVLVNNGTTARWVLPQDLAEPIPWDDGLDVSKLHVKHESTGE